MNKLLSYVFRLSYIAIDFGYNRKKPFDRWDLIKRRLDKKINIAVFQFVGKTELNGSEFSTDYSKQFILDAVNDIILHHYKRRLKIFRIRNRNQSSPIEI